MRGVSTAAGPFLAGLVPRVYNGLIGGRGVTGSAVNLVGFRTVEKPMSDETLIERRLSVVEATVAELQRRLPEARAVPDWLDQVIGSLNDEPDFEAVLAHGRAFREADRPTGDSEL